MHLRLRKSYKETNTFITLRKVSNGFLISKPMIHVPPLSISGFHHHHQMPEFFSQIISMQFFVRTNSYFEIHSRIYLFLRKPDYCYSTAYIKGKSNWSSLNDENLLEDCKGKKGGGVFLYKHPRGASSAQRQTTFWLSGRGNALHWTIIQFLYFMYSNFPL